MFLKVKRTTGKQYFALCESVRRDNKIVTKNIRSLGNADKAHLILKAEYPQFLDRFNEIVGTKKCRDNNDLDIIKNIVCDNGYRNYLKRDTKICLSHVDSEGNTSQIVITLLNDDVMTYLTICKHDKSFIGWEITPATNKYFDEHKKNHFTNNENDLYVLSHRCVRKVVSEFHEWLDDSVKCRDNNLMFVC